MPKRNRGNRNRGRNPFAAPGRNKNDVPVLSSSKMPIPLSPEIAALLDCVRKAEWHRDLSESQPGTTPLSPRRRYLKCARCKNRFALPPDAADEDAYAFTIGGVLRHREMGYLFTPRLVAYCPSCAAYGIEICQCCGCTWEAMCSSRCYWVAPGVCSECELLVQPLEVVHAQ